MKKFIIMLMLIVLIVSLPVSAAEHKLTIERAVQINDTQIVIEFSEPIAININQTNNGPYVALRIGDNGYPAYVEEQDNHLQWHGTIEFVDKNRDRILWTLVGKSFGIKDINDIRNRTGLLADYKDKFMWLTVEEVPYNVDLAYTDNAICNITTLDGEVYLTPTFPNGWESCNLEVERDYGYDIDYDEVFYVDVKDFEQSVLLGGADVEQPTESEEPDPVQTVTVIKNDPILIAVRLGIGVLLCGGLLVVGVIIRRKRKADSK